MSILKDAERREKSASLKQYNNQIVVHVNALKAIKTQLGNLKTTIQGDAVNFTSADADDVQTVLDALSTLVAGI